MNSDQLRKLIMEEEDVKTKPIFGDLGIFYQDVMFALVGENKLFLKGGGWLDSWFKRFDCNHYVLVKKSSTSVINYYDITKLVVNHHSYVRPLIGLSKKLAVQQRSFHHDIEKRRIRNLANMHVSLERMLKKSGVNSLDDLFSLGAAHAFVKIRAVYGKNTDKKVLLKLYGAIHGIHWQLIQEPKLRCLLQEVNIIENDL